MRLKNNFNELNKAVINFLEVIGIGKVADWLNVVLKKYDIFQK